MSLSINDLVNFFTSFAPEAKTSVICDPIKELASFDAPRYMGNWFEIMHTKDEGFQPNSWKCNQATYTDLDSEGNFKVYNSSQAFIGPRFGVHGDAKCPAETGPGQCFVKFFLQPYDTPNYQIIDTDYETYSIIYACHANSAKNFLWIMSRTPTMDQAVLKQALVTATLNLPNFNFDNLITDVQGEENGCSYAKDASVAEAVSQLFLF